MDTTLQRVLLCFDSIKVLASIGAERISLTPYRPTVAELAPALDVSLWNGLFVQKDTPQDLRYKIIAVAALHRISLRRKGRVMTLLKGLQGLFKPYRRPGDIVFAWAFLAFSLFLLGQLSTQAHWKSGGKIVSQPAFWPALSVCLMAGFAALHLLSSALSPRLTGRWAEVWDWICSVECGGWFIAYVFIVPQLGYLGTTVLSAVLLSLRAG